MPSAAVFDTISDMYVVQLAVEGVPALPERTRVAFRGHLDVLRVSSRDARAAILDIFFHTLFPDPERAYATSAIVDSRAERKRALLTVSGRDRVPHRVMRDLETGRSRLYRFDQKTTHHEILSESASEVQQFLRLHHQLPDDRSFERLFMLGPDSRPSSGAKARLRSGSEEGGLASFSSGLSGPVGLGAGSALGIPDARSELTSTFPLPSLLSEATGVHKVPSGFSIHNALVQEELAVSGTADLASRSSTGELQGQRRELTRDLQRAKRAERLEQALDQLTEKEDAATRAVEARETLELEREKLEAKVLSGQEAIGDTRELGRRLDRYERLDSHFRAEREAIERELAEVSERKERIGTGRWFRDRFFIGGVVSAVVCAGLALGIGDPTPLFGQVLFGSLAGWAAIRALERELTQHELEAATVELKDRLSHSERQHRVETSTVRGTMNRLGIEASEELRERLEDQLELEGRLAEVEVRLESEEGRRGLRGREVLTRIKERKTELERELDGLRAHDLTVAGVERRIAALDRELQARSQGNARSEPAMGEGADDGDRDDNGYRPSEDRPASPDPHDPALGEKLAARTRVLLETASDLVGQTKDALAPVVGPRVARYIRALTAKRFDAAELDDLGRFRVGRGEEWVRFESLEGALLDQVDAGLRFGLLESVLRVRRVPVVIEEPFAALPPDRRPVVKQIYAHLAKIAQLIVVTPADDLEGNVVVLV